MEDCGSDPDEVETVTVEIDCLDLEKATVGVVLVTVEVGMTVVTVEVRMTGVTVEAEITGVTLAEGGGRECALEILLLQHVCFRRVTHFLFFEFFGIFLTGTGLGGGAGFGVKDLALCTSHELKFTQIHSPSLYQVQTALPQ